jgi:exopolyphosphatase / guanosine-5'-triphosphate,3'-diphosphate pyrophosphatase
MRVASIDIGTNSVLLLVAERKRDGSVVPVLERATITRLGEGVDRTRTLLPAAVERTLACLAAYAEDIREASVDRIEIVGTSAMRDAAGGDDFRERAAQLIGVEPRVISGEEEASLTFMGALSGLPYRGEITVFDIGGGSTELIVGAWDGRLAESVFSVSLDIGSVRLTERFLASDPPDQDELDALTAHVDGVLAELPAQAKGLLVGVAGTVTTLAAYAHEIAPYDAERVHGSVLGRHALEAALRDLSRCTVAERRRLTAIDEKRADVIVAGAVIASRILDWADRDSLVVSDRGVRWGLALRALGSSTPSSSSSSSSPPPRPSHTPPASGR